MRADGPVAVHTLPFPFDAKHKKRLPACRKLQLAVSRLTSQLRNRATLGFLRVPTRLWELVLGSWFRPGASGLWAVVFHVAQLAASSIL